LEVIKLIEKLINLYERTEKSTLFYLTIILVAMFFIIGMSYSYRVYEKAQLNTKYENLKEKHELLKAENRDLELKTESLYEEVSRVANSRDIDEYTKLLMSRYIDNNKEIDIIRNEILYRNEISVAEASYQAMWIYVASVENNVDPLLTLSIALKENNLRHRVDNKVTVNEKRAKGMFQITPIVESIYNMNALIFEENVLMGAKFISKQLERYDSTRLALAHYNAGSRVHTALKSYPETIDYVKTVLNYYAIFQEKMSLD
jgi:soluble lytic murein transglycosylase-like protein